MYVPLPSFMSNIFYFFGPYLFSGLWLGVFVFSVVMKG